MDGLAERPTLESERSEAIFATLGVDDVCVEDGGGDDEKMLEKCERGCRLQQLSKATYSLSTISLPITDEISDPFGARCE